MKEHQAERPRFTLEQAREIHEAPSPMISQIAKTDSGMEYPNPEEHYWRSTEFSCAMRKLDDLGIPRKDEEGETYSIVGRINLLAKR
jgi:hypothetical protein